MATPDFVVKFDPKNEPTEVLTERIFYSIFIRQIKGKKPVVLFLSGDSGEGKSFTGLKIQEILFKIQGLDIKRVLQDINVYTPLEYPTKLNALLFPKETSKDPERIKDLKQANVLCMHEAREVVKAKNWHSFINTAISDVNAMSRSVKRICTIIISQFIRDISTDIRYTIQYYCKVYRPIGKRTRLYIYKMWKDDRDLEKPKLRKRKLRGYYVLPNGRYKRYMPEYFEITKPDKETIELFEKSDTDAKAKIIRKKMDKLIKEMSIDIETGNKKVEAMVNWYSENLENLKIIGKRVRNKFKLKPEVKEMHDLSREEVKDFQDMLNDVLKKKGVIDDE